jgi:hypothetical protein
MAVIGRQGRPVACDVTGYTPTIDIPSRAGE